MIQKHREFQKPRTSLCCALMDLNAGYFWARVFAFLFRVKYFSRDAFQGTENGVFIGIGLPDRRKLTKSPHSLHGKPSRKQNRYMIFIKQATMRQWITLYCVCTRRVREIFAWDDVTIYSTIHVVDDPWFQDDVNFTWLANSWVLSHGVNPPRLPTKYWWITNLWASGTQFVFFINANPL